MILAEAVTGLNPQQKIKVGANKGTRYFYIGNSDDLTKKINFGYPELGGKIVVEIREADQAADPGVVIIMVEGRDKGYYWSTDEFPGPALDFGWGWC